MEPSSQPARQTPARQLPGSVLGRRGGDLERVSPASFRSPDSCFSPSLMWIWNDVLQPEELRRQLADMASHGVRAVLPVPEPKEFRPTSMPTRLEPDYLSRGFLEAVRAAVAECARLGMRFWLYDEGGWPSGSVCGRLVREHPELARQGLEGSVVEVAEGSAVTVPTDALGGYLLQGPAGVARVAQGDSVRVRRAGARWLVARVQRGVSYPDLLNPRATDLFLQMTHDLYGGVVGAEFGRTIPAVFTDEPQASARPWTEGLAEDFRRTYGYDLLEVLPSLFEGETEADWRVRIDYHDWWSRRFADEYLGRIQAWCRAHGLLSTGHLNGEDETLGAIRHGYGNLMRCLRRLDIPGIDVIWRQLWPGQANSDFPLHAASVAHQEGRRWTLSESYAVYCSGVTPAQLKWVADYQFVRGITLLDLVGYPYSTRDWLVGGERPHFHDGDPLWRWSPLFHGYLTRLSYLLSLGRPSASTALYFPMRDLVVGGSHAQQTAAGFDRLCRLLLESACAFDLVDDDVLGRPETRAADDALAVGPMAYRTVVVPRCRWMPTATTARLAELGAAGGRVLFVDPADGAAGFVALTEGVVPAAVPRLLRTDQPAPGLRVLKRDLANGRLYFLTNESPEALRCRATFAEAGRPVELDPVSRAVRRVALPGRPFGGGARPAVCGLAGPALPGPGGQGGAGSAAPGRWGGRARGGLDAPGGAGVRDHRQRPDPAGGRRGPGVSGGAGRLAPRAGGRVRRERGLRGRVRAHRGPGTAGGLGGPGRGALRGRGNDQRPSRGGRVWPPWTCPVPGRVRAGQNHLRVVVGNTLANQYVHTRALDRWQPHQLGPYHPMALKFEVESLPSGLYGPVVLRGAGAGATGTGGICSPGTSTSCRSAGRPPCAGTT